MSALGRKTRLLLSVSAMPAIIAPAANAQWQRDGLPVTTSATAYQISPAVCDDGNGGAIVAWTDNRNGNDDIYAQRFDANGVRLWGDAGLPVCVESSIQQNPEIISDGAGGAIIVWRDRRLVNYPLFAQRLDSQGTPLWTENGIHAGTTRATSPFQRIAANGAGGAMVSWLGDANSVVLPDQWSAYTQQLDENGVPEWSFPWGEPANSVDIQPLNLATAADGSGGVLLVWYQDVGGTYVQRLDSAGNKLWGTNGVEVYDIHGVNLQLSVTRDGAGGAFVGWSDNFGPLHVQRVSSAGQESWNQNGVILAGPGAMVIRSVSDGQNGAIFVWGDSPDIHAQRIDTLGVFPWGPDGTVVCAATDYRLLWHAASDDLGGALAVWTDRRDRPEQDIYVQRIDSDGNAVWLANGVGVCKAAEFQSAPRVVNDGNGGAIAVWRDERGAFPEVYVQRVDNTGTPVPTYLKSHSAFFGAGVIHVEWTVSATGGVPCFTVYRADRPDEWREHFVNVSGAGSYFQFEDDRVELGKFYQYRVAVTDELEKRLLFETGRIEAVAPSALSAQSFPNPFNPSTTIRYTLPEAANMTLSIYSLNGRLVRLLESRDRTPGTYEVRWHGVDDRGQSVGSGVYVYRLVAGSRRVTGKIIFLK